MLKKIIIVLCFLLLSKLQYSQNGKAFFDIPISIAVSNSLIINKVSGEMDFGEVFAAGTDQILTKNPQDGVLFEVTGISRARISIDYSSIVVMDNSNWVSNYGGKIDNIIFTPNVRHTLNNSTYVKSRKLRDGGTLRLTNVNGLGKLFIWLGGELTVSGNQELGNYFGTFSLTVAY